MLKLGRKSKQLFQFAYPIQIQIFKKMTEDGLAWQYELEIEMLASYDFCKIVTYRPIFSRSWMFSFHFL